MAIIPLATDRVGTDPLTPLHTTGITDLLVRTFVSIRSRNVSKYNRRTQQRYPDQDDLAYCASFHRTPPPQRTSAQTQNTVTPID